MVYEFTDSPFQTTQFQPQTWANQTLKWENGTVKTHEVTVVDYTAEDNVTIEIQPKVRFCLYIQPELLCFSTVKTLSLYNCCVLVQSKLCLCTTVVF